MESRERLAELSEAGGILTLTMALQRPWESKNEQHEAISHLSILLRGITELNENSAPQENKFIPIGNDSDHTTSEELEELPKLTETKLEGTSRTSEDSSSLSTKPDDVSKNNGRGRDNVKDPGINGPDEERRADSPRPGKNNSICNVDNDGNGKNGCQDEEVKEYSSPSGRRVIVQVVPKDQNYTSEYSSNGLHASDSMEDIPEILTIPSNEEASHTKGSGDDGTGGRIEGKSDDDKCAIQ
jgi:hypothetical protein